MLDLAFENPLFSQLIGARRYLNNQKRSELEMILTNSIVLDKKDVGVPKPLYEQVKFYVLKNIGSGEWPTHFQIPSEHTLVKNMGISRMTIHRALRELTQEGFLKRIQGVGTFVAETPHKNITIEFKDIDVSIREQGRHHQCDVHFLQVESITSDYAARLGLQEGDRVYRSYMVHRENGVPVMLEDRYVNPKFSADFVDQDFTQLSTESYFRASFAMISHDHHLLAVTSNPEAHHFLELEQPTPCIQINRRTWSENNILSVVRLLYPSHRHELRW